MTEIKEGVKVFSSKVILGQGEVIFVRRSPNGQRIYNVEFQGVTGNSIYQCQENELEVVPSTSIL